jgi:proteic killer suppression protein
MIRSFGDKRTETLFWDGVVREFRSIAPRAKRKLEAINAASRLEDLRVPPSNRLEKLKGDLGDFYSIRINDQWRIIPRRIRPFAKSTCEGSRYFTEPYCRDRQQSAAHYCRYGTPIKFVLRQQSGILVEFANPLRLENGKAKS